MSVILSFVLVIISCVAATSHVRTAGNGNGATAVAGSSGDGGGFAGAYDTSGGVGVSSGQPFDFQSLFNDYFGQMAQFHSNMANHVGTYAYTNGDWTNVKAESSMTYDTPQRIQQLNSNLMQQGQNLANRIANQAQAAQTQFPSNGQGYGYSGGFSSGSGGFPQGAFASGSIGNGGAQQTAAVFPENPNNPNIINRFGTGGGGGADGSNYYGVVSHSSSSNVNGQPQHVAETVINDNGKITKYRVHNP